MALFEIGKSGQKLFEKVVRRTLKRAWRKRKAAVCPWRKEENIPKGSDSFIESLKKRRSPSSKLSRKGVSQ
jgi:hypothetical protein